VDRFDKLIEAAHLTVIAACVAGDEQLVKLAQANAILAQVARGYQLRASAAESALADISEAVESAHSAQQGN